MTIILRISLYMRFRIRLFQHLIVVFAVNAFRVIRNTLYTL